MLTLGFVFLFTYHDGAREFAEKTVWPAIVALVVGFATIIAISCCESVRHTSPHNFIVLAIFTIAEGYIVGVSTLHAKPEVVNPICSPFPNENFNIDGIDFHFFFLANS